MTFLAYACLGPLNPLELLWFKKNVENLSPGRERAKTERSLRVFKFYPPRSIVITRLGDAGRPILSYWWVEREYLLAPARLAENKAVDHAWSVGDSSLNDLCEGLALEVAKELGGHHSKKNEWSVVP